MKPKIVWYVQPLDETSQKLLCTLLLLGTGDANPLIRYEENSLPLYKVSYALVEALFIGGKGSIEFQVYHRRQNEAKPRTGFRCTKKAIEEGKIASAMINYAREHQEAGMLSPFPLGPHLRYARKEPTRLAA